MITTAAPLRPLALALVTALALSFALAPAPAGANVLQDVRALFDQRQDEADPFEPVHAYYVNAAEQAHEAGDLTEALEYYLIARTLDRRDRDSYQAARELLKELSQRAVQEYEQGVSLYESGDMDGARARFLEALRLNPSFTKPLAYLKDKMLVQPNEDYTIVEDDTLLRISEKLYDNPGGELLLTRINGLSIADRLSPGENIKAPVVSASLSRRLAPPPEAEEPTPARPETETAVASPAPAPEPAQAPAETEETGELAQAQSTGTEALLAMARLQFRNGLYETAVSMTDEILSNNPGQDEATDIRNNSYYNLGRQMWEQNAPGQAMRYLRRVPEGFKDVDALRAEVQEKLMAESEPHYLAGVRHFLNEDLEQAVQEWEIALEINPFHAKARADLQKARKLLEAVRGL